MINTEDLYEKYGKNIVFLFKGDAPYVEKEGHPAGVLIERDNKVLCNECGEWFEALGNHLKPHGLNADSYREKYGFNRGAPLCAAFKSQALREKQLENMKNPDYKKKALRALERGHRTMKEKGIHASPNDRIQHSNTRYSCKEQIKQRYRLLQQRYGTDVSLNIIRQTDSGIEKHAVINYGSWNNFKKAIGETIDTSSYEKEKADLIYELRTYVKKHKELPWEPHTYRRLNNFPFSTTPYITKWGSVGRATYAVGIHPRYDTWRAFSGKRKQWFVV